jgi:hypothetical protein
VLASDIPGENRMSQKRETPEVHADARTDLRRRPVRRPDPGKIRPASPDKSLTGVAGLPAFGRYLRSLGVDGELSRRFKRLKSGPKIAYPMGAQLRLLMDAFVVGQTRVFGVKELATDALFVHLAGGVLPSLQTLYEDLDRFDDHALAELEALMAAHGLAALPARRATHVHLDVGCITMPIAAEPHGGPLDAEPRPRGEPSFRPVLAVLADTGTIVGARLRSGEAGLGRDDLPALRRWVVRARDLLDAGDSLCVRVAANDVGELLRMLREERALYVVTPNLSEDVLATAHHPVPWKTAAFDVAGEPVRQVAQLTFARHPWKDMDPSIRVVVARWKRRHGKHLVRAGDVGWTYQIFLTNRSGDVNDIVYSRRDGLRPWIAELKRAWGIDHSSGHGLAVNHALLLLKLLTYNLFERYMAREAPALPRDHVRRRAVLVAPGRLSVSGRIPRLRVLPGSPLSRPSPS